ncbi:MAG: 4'-phosphopantetheinyl transferase superfamily protein [Solirubrobacteraceae bacterium]|jgi:4'-phosphopantetheinyl transferase
MRAAKAGTTGIEMLKTISWMAVLDQGVVDVWRIPLDGAVERHLRVLSAAERARVERRCGLQRDRFVIAHGAMREVLGVYLNCAPAFVPLTVRHGEPPRTLGLKISLSHSEDLALLAVSRATVGVDVEHVSAAQDGDLDEVAELTLSPGELAVFRGSRMVDRPRVWLRSWTRKEAVVKAHRDALAERAISDLDVLEGTVQHLTVEDLDVGPRHVAALAAAQPPRQIVLRAWADEPA